MLMIVNSPSYRPTVQISFLELSTKWEQTVLPQHKPSSQNSERVHLKQLKDYFGDMPVADISTEVAQRWISTRTQAPKTVRNMLATLRLVFRTGKAWGYIDRNPCDDVQLPRLDEKRGKCYTEDQIRQIIAEAEEPYKTLFWIVAETGMRGGEVCGLALDDIDLKNGQVRVRQSAWQGKLQSPKTRNAIRVFVISPMLTCHIQRFMMNHWQENPDRLLFSKDGRPLDNRFVVRYQLQPLTDRLGIERAGLHASGMPMLRQWIRITCPLPFGLSAWGTAKFATTLGYTHAVSEDHRRTAEQLGQRFCPGLPPVEGM